MNQSLDGNFSHTAKLWLGCLVGAFVLAALLMVTTPAAAGIFDKVRSAVRGSTSSDSSSDDDSSDDDRDRDHDRQRDRHRNRKHHYDDDDDDFFAEFFGEMFGTLFLYILSPSADAYYPRHPYEGGRPGYLILENSRDEDGPPGYRFPENELLVMDNARWWAGRVSLEYGDDFDAVYRVGGSLFLETTPGIGLESSWHSFHERLLGGTDQFWIGDANVVIRNVGNQFTQWRWGIGVNWLDNAQGTDAGLNFTLGADFYPNDPFIVSSEIDWGWLGAAKLFHGRVSLGVIRHGWEMFAGYDYYNIGGVKIDGPMLGLRFWF